MTKLFVIIDEGNSNGDTCLWPVLYLCNLTILGYLPSPSCIESITSVHVLRHAEYTLVFIRGYIHFLYFPLFFMFRLFSRFLFPPKIHPHAFKRP